MHIFLSILENVLLVLNVAVAIYGIYFLALGIMCLFFRPKKSHSDQINRFALVIAARNEREVIGNLIDSLKKLDYPKDMYDIYVVPNNCTDDTEEVARAHGALIYKCEQPVKMKADALSQVFDYLLESEKNYDAFCVFDADNLVDKNFLLAMNDSYNCGSNIAQGFRDAKNPHDSWISGSYAVYYYCVNSFMSKARRAIGMSAYINGTGFMVSSRLIRKLGFNTYTLTEDNEYSIQCILEGEKVEYVPDAIVYDEHPVTMGVSFKQRLRWSKGLISCCHIYTGSLIKCCLKKQRSSALDAILFSFGPVIQIVALFFAGLTILLAWLNVISLRIIMLQNIQLFALLTLLMVIFFPMLTAVLAGITNGKKPGALKQAIVAFPLFIITWLPINIVALFDRKQTWEPVKHTSNISMAELTEKTNV